MAARRRRLLDPYRQSSRPGAEREPPTDLEQWAVHGVLAVVGALGVALGFAYERPTELAVGGLLLIGLIWTNRAPRP